MTLKQANLKFETDNSNNLASPFVIITIIELKHLIAYAESGVQAFAGMV